MFFYVGENTGDGELDLSGIDDSEIDRVRCAFIPSLPAFAYLRKKKMVLIWCILSISASSLWQCLPLIYREVQVISVIWGQS